MTKPDMNDAFPILHRHSYPRTASEVSLAHEQIALFNLSIDPATDPEKREAARKRLSILATGGPPFGDYVQRIWAWYSRHLSITPVRLSQNLPRPTPLPKRPLLFEFPPDSLFSGQAS